MTTTSSAAATRRPRPWSASCCLTGKPFVLVEASKEALDRMSGLGSFPFVQGDATDDDVLIKAGVERAKGILMSLPSR